MSAAARNAAPTQIAQASELPPILESLLVDNAQPTALRPRDRLALLRSQIAPGCTDEELALFLEVARRRRLDPFARQIYAIRRKNREKQGNQWVDVFKMTIQTGIDGFRLVAHRADPHYTIDAPTFEIDQALRSSTNPAALRSCSIRVWKSGATRPVEATVMWSEYAQILGSGDDASLGPMWKKMPHNMLEKVAEAKALRKAFPEELADLHIEEETHASVAVDEIFPSVTAPKETPSLRADATPKRSDAAAKLLAEIEACASSAALLAWGDAPATKKRSATLDDGSYQRVHDAFNARLKILEEQANSPGESKAAAAATSTDAPSDERPTAEATK